MEARSLDYSEQTLYIRIVVQMFLNFKCYILLPNKVAT